MRGPINVKSPNNITNWQMRFNSAFKGLNPSGYYAYHQFNIQEFYVLPTQYIYVFCVDLRTNIDYFPIQHELTEFTREI
jgi:hypothetical protein